MPHRSAQEALRQWNIFQQAPGVASQSLSFRVHQGPAALGTAHCNVSGIALVDTQATANNRDVINNNFAPQTRVACLRVQASAAGADPYWYPYLANNVNGGTFNGVGEVTVPHNAPAGTIALTNSMNGCSLRMYQHNVTDQIRIFHDNNGAYVVHGTMTGTNWTHLCSINSANTPAKRRGALVDNILYWDPAMGATSSVCLICRKSTLARWEIYRHVSDSGVPVMNARNPLFGRAYTEYTYNWVNAQQFNGVLHTQDQN